MTLPLQTSSLPPFKNTQKKSQRRNLAKRKVKKEIWPKEKTKRKSGQKKSQKRNLAKRKDKEEIWPKEKSKKKSGQKGGKGYYRLVAYIVIGINAQNSKKKRRKFKELFRVAMTIQEEVSLPAGEKCLCVRSILGCGYEKF